MHWKLRFNLGAFHMIDLAALVLSTCAFPGAAPAVYFFECELLHRFLS